MPRRASELRLIIALLLCSACASSAPALTSTELRQDPPPSVLLDDEKSDPLGACATPCLAYEKTDPPEGALSRSEAAAAGIGSDDAPSSALHANITLGKEFGRPPGSPDDATTDAEGDPIVSRPAWILVYSGQRIPLPSGPGPADGGRPPEDQPSYFATTVASIIDSQSGELLQGWACETATEHPDGRVEVQRGTGE